MWYILLLAFALLPFAAGQWAATGSGLPGASNLVVFNSASSEFYALSNGGKGVYKYSSSPSPSWALVGSGITSSVAMDLRALIFSTVNANTAYVGGFFTGSGLTPMTNIAKFDLGTFAYSALGTGCNGKVISMTEANSLLWVGGAFSACGGVATASYVARFNSKAGTWGAAGTAIKGQINALVTVTSGATSSVFAGGAVGVFKWANVATSTDWTAVGTITSGVNAMAYDSTTSSLLVGGSFVLSSGTNTFTNIAQLAVATNTWSKIGGGLSGGAVLSILSMGGGAVFTGSFTSAGGAATPVRYMAAYGQDPQTGVASFNDLGAATDAALGTGFTGTSVNSFAANSDFSVQIAVGSFSTFSGISAANAAVMISNTGGGGSPAASYVPPSPPPLPTMDYSPPPPDPNASPLPPSVSPTATLSRGASVSSTNTASGSPWPIGPPSASSTGIFSPSASLTSIPQAPSPTPAAPSPSSTSAIVPPPPVGTTPSPSLASSPSNAPATPSSSPVTPTPSNSPTKLAPSLTPTSTAPPVSASSSKSPAAPSMSATATSSLSMAPSMAPSMPAVMSPEGTMMPPPPSGGTCTWNAMLPPMTLTSPVSALALDATTFSIYVGTTGGAGAQKLSPMDGSLTPVGAGLQAPVTALAGSTAALVGADVRAILLASNGAVIFGGSFSPPSQTIAASSANLVRWLPTTSSYGAMQSGVNNRVNALAEMGGFVFVGGQFTSSTTVPTSYVVRYSLSGNTFSGAGTGLVIKAAVTALTSVGGTAIYAATQPASSTSLTSGILFSYNSAINEFVVVAGSPTSGTITAITAAVAPAAGATTSTAAPKIFIAGSFSFTASGVTIFDVASYSASGGWAPLAPIGSPSATATFISGGMIKAMMYLPDRNGLLVMGSFTSIRNDPLVRYLALYDDASGAFMPFGTVTAASTDPPSVQADGPVNTAALTPDGYAIIGGNFSTLGSCQAQYLATGQLPPAPSPSPSPSTGAISMTPTASASRLVIPSGLIPSFSSTASVSASVKASPPPAQVSPSPVAASPSTVAVSPSSIAASPAAPSASPARGTSASPSGAVVAASISPSSVAAASPSSTVVPSPSASKAAAPSPSPSADAASPAALPSSSPGVVAASPSPSTAAASPSPSGVAAASPSRGVAASPSGAAAASPSGVAAASPSPSALASSSSATKPSPSGPSTPSTSAVPTPSSSPTAMPSQSKGASPSSSPIAVKVNFSLVTGASRDRILGSDAGQKLRQAVSCIAQTGVLASDVKIVSTRDLSASIPAAPMVVDRASPANVDAAGSFYTCPNNAADVGPTALPTPSAKALAPSGGSSAAVASSLTEVALEIEVRPVSTLAGARVLQTGGSASGEAALGGLINTLSGSSAGSTSTPTTSTPFEKAVANILYSTAVALQSCLLKGANLVVPGTKPSIFNYTAVRQVIMAMPDVPKVDTRMMPWLMALAVDPTLPSSASSGTARLLVDASSSSGAPPMFALDSFGFNINNAQSFALDSSSATSAALIGFATAPVASGPSPGPNDGTNNGTASASSSSSSMIPGIVAAVVVILALVGIAAFFIVRRQRTKRVTGRRLTARRGSTLNAGKNGFEMGAFTAATINTNGNPTVIVMTNPAQQQQAGVVRNPLAAALPGSPLSPTAPQSASLPSQAGPRKTLVFPAMAVGGEQNHQAAQQSSTNDLHPGLLSSSSDTARPSSGGRASTGNNVALLNPLNFGSGLNTSTTASASAVLRGEARTSFATWNPNQPAGASSSLPGPSDPANPDESLLIVGPVRSKRMTFAVMPALPAPQTATTSVPQGSSAATAKMDSLRVFSSSKKVATRIPSSNRMSAAAAQAASGGDDEPQGQPRRQDGEDDDAW